MIQIFLDKAQVESRSNKSNSIEIIILTITKIWRKFSNFNITEPLKVYVQIQLFSLYWVYTLHISCILLGQDYDLVILNP